jgi:hypothetical protein
MGGSVAEDRGANDGGNNCDEQTAHDAVRLFPSPVANSF